MKKVLNIINNLPVTYKHAFESDRNQIESI